MGGPVDAIGNIFNPDSPPKPPDYAGAAEATAQGSRESNEQATWANRPNQYTPWGSTEWSNQPVWDPTTGTFLNRWQQDINLDPAAQMSLDAQQGTGLARSLLAMQMTGRLPQEYGEAMDWNNFDDMGGTVGRRELQTEVGAPSDEMRMRSEDAVYGKMTSRLDDRFERDDERLKATLLNQGLRPGDEAYDRAMTEATEGQTDAYDQAMMSAIMAGGQEAQRDLGMDVQRLGFGNQAEMMEQTGDMSASGFNSTRRQQQIAEAMQERGFTLNEIQAILSGQQVQMPNMPGFTQAGRAQGPDYLNAANMQNSADNNEFSAQQQIYNNTLQGIGDIGMGAMMMFCDRRLKKNIRKIGETAGGTNIYSFQYIWGGPEVMGPMADEVPEAASDFAGFKIVDLSKVK